MSAQLQPAFSEYSAPRAPSIPVELFDAPVRRSLTQMFNNVAAGFKPQQPHADGNFLLSDAELAAPIMREVGLALAEMLGGTYLRGPTKDIVRAEAKARERATNLSYNHDYSRSCIPLRNNDQIRNAIDIFHSPGTITLAGGLKLHVLDVDNTFIKENPKKPGLRNLDLKIAVPITLADGTESYHIAELQFRRKGTEKAYTESHKVYEEARKALLLRQIIENKMDMSGDPGTIRSLERHWLQSNETYTALMQQRKDINVAIAQKLGLDELIGYQPCSSRNAQMLALVP